MARFFIRRIVLAVPVMIIVAVFVFMVLHLVPGNPAYLILGDDARPEDAERLTRELGLDRPVLIQLVDWMGSLARGDLGESLFISRPVTEVLLLRIDPTLPLATIAMLIAISVGIPLGILAAVNRNTYIDRIVMVVVTTGVAIPGFWLGLLLILYVGVNVRWIPVAGYSPIAKAGLFGALRYLLLPGIALGFSQATMIARMTRSTMLEILTDDFIRTARAKGLGERVVILRHALRNAMISVVTVIGISAGVVLGGSVVIEKVFALPGLGLLMIDSITRRDYPLVQGGILVLSFIYVIVNLVVDMLYGVLDPRVRR